MGVLPFAPGRSRPWYLVVNGPRDGWHAHVSERYGTLTPLGTCTDGVLALVWINPTWEGKFTDCMGPSIVAPRCPSRTYLTLGAQSGTWEEKLHQSCPNYATRVPPPLRNNMSTSKKSSSPGPR